MNHVPIRPEQTNVRTIKTQIQNFKPQIPAGREILLLIISIIKNVPTQCVVKQTKIYPFHEVKNVLRIVVK
jgi:hypothetical protein